MWPMLTVKELTAEEFLTLAEMHPDKRFDFMDGELVEASSKPLYGRKQVLFAVAFEAYVQRNPAGVVYTEVLHMLAGEKFIPDVCINVTTTDDYLTVPPLCVVEIRSDTQSRESQRRKARAYVQHGIRLMILVLPGEQVEVYQPGRTVQILLADDVLDGGAVLPGFRLPLAAILSI